MASSCTSWSFSAIISGTLQPIEFSQPSSHLPKHPLPQHNSKTNCSSRCWRNKRSGHKLCSPSDALSVTNTSPEEDHCSLQLQSSSSSSSIPLSVSPNLRTQEEVPVGTSRNQFAVNMTRRRGFVFMATLPPLLFHTAGFDAYADESDFGEDSVIRHEVRKVLSKAKAAGVLRLAFHDAGTFDMKENTGGMNGSIIYELDRVENAGLSKTVKVLDKSKKELDKVLSVSWADLIAIAGTEAVLLCGGPSIPVKIEEQIPGPLLAPLLLCLSSHPTHPSIPDPTDRLPQESLDAAALKKCFLHKGFSTQELVALSGAHTLGNKGFGNPYIFDNSYYNILLEKPWTSSAGMSSMIGLPSDRALVEDEECLRWIKTYASDQAKFFDDFSHAYTKLVNLGATWN